MGRGKGQGQAAWERTLPGEKVKESEEGLLRGGGKDRLKRELL